MGLPSEQQTLLSDSPSNKTPPFTAAQFLLSELHHLVPEPLATCTPVHLQHGLSRLRCARGVKPFQISKTSFGKNEALLMVKRKHYFFFLI